VGEWRAGKPISPNTLASLLKPFGIVPGTIRIGDTTPKGYQLAHFQDAFDTYLYTRNEAQYRHNGRYTQYFLAFATATL
jgi:hypothetical protein